MCATCVAQGVVYVSGAVAGLRVIGARAKAKRLAGEGTVAGPADDPRGAENHVSDRRPRERGAVGTT